MADLTLQSLVKRFTKVAPTAARALRGSNVESLMTTKCEPDGTDLSRAGRRFQTALTSAFTGRAPSTTVPTTTAAFLLWNGESDNGRSYLIEDLGAFLLSGTNAVGIAIIWAMTTQKIAQPTSAGGYVIRSTSRSGLQSKAIIADNQTITDPAGWAVYKPNPNPASATIGGGTTKDGLGRLLLPPGYGLAWNVLSGAGTTPLFLGNAMWSELELDIE